MGTAARTVLRFSYDGRSGLRAGAKVKNMAGKGRGIVRVADGGRFRKVKGHPRRAARFPQSGYGIIETADRRAWDPRRRDFAYGTWMKVTQEQRNALSNVMQKGYYRQRGGQWKLQLDRGLPSCVVNGSDGRVLVRSQRSVADGRWHRVVCRRVDNSLVLRVDGTIVASGTGQMGSVTNSAGVRIGARKLGPGRVDQFRGRLDMTFLSMG